MTGAVLSPNGRYVAVRTSSPQGRSVLSIVDIATRQSKLIAGFGNADVGAFSWLTNERLTLIVNNVDHGGEIGRPGMFTIDRDGSNLNNVTELARQPHSFAEGANESRCCDYETTLRGFAAKGDEMFLRIAYEEDTDKSAFLVVLDTHTRLYRRIPTPSGTYSWLTDPEGTVRITVARQGDNIVLFHFDKGKWNRLYAYGANAETAYLPLLYLNGIIYMHARNGEDEAAIHRYDVQKKALDPQPLLSAPGFDMDGRFLHDEKQMLGFRFTTDAEMTVWFDNAMKAAQQEVDQLLPATINLISRGRASVTPYVLVNAYSATQDHIYLLYDTETKKQIKLGESRPDIDAGQMAPMSFERFQARDGLQVPAFVTLPQSVAKKKLPTVVLVGEQPDKRNGRWEWTPEVQFLASRGYAVLQPEPRGESGFGLRHRKAGEQQWGRAVQNDIADAVKWAVAQGYTDPARVCIAGTGYGGYAAMMELLKHGDTYQCAISWAGIVDFKGGPDAATPPAELSLLQNASSIKHPVLLAYGKEDSKADYKVGRQFYEAVSAGNPNAVWLSYTPSAEAWKTQQNRIDLWRQIEAFLGRHIGAK